MSLTNKWIVNPESFSSKLKTKVKNKTLELANRIFDEVVERTPVNTGRARACWTLSEGSPVFNSISGNSNSGSIVPPPERPNLTNMSEFTRLYIANGQPYIVKLEYGYSNQAPSGMVRIALAGLK